jgi:hypothetical protein
VAVTVPAVAGSAWHVLTHLLTLSLELSARLGAFVLADVFLVGRLALVEVLRPIAVLMSATAQVVGLPPYLARRDPVEEVGLRLYLAL